MGFAEEEIRGAWQDNVAEAASVLLVTLQHSFREIVQEAVKHVVKEDMWQPSANLVKFTFDSLEFNMAEIQKQILRKEATWRRLVSLRQTRTQHAYTRNWDGYRRVPTHCSDDRTTWRTVYRSSLHTARN